MHFFKKVYILENHGEIISTLQNMVGTKLRKTSFFFRKNLIVIRAFTKNLWPWVKIKFFFKVFYPMFKKY